MSRGFSLVELSVVLVIIGLLTGGILAGQSLMRASELRSVATDFEHYKSAIEIFKSKFDAIPGDFSSATDVWGTRPTGCPGDSTTPSTDARTCNGNDNRQITPGASMEAYLHWQHMANAGLITGTTYTGVTGGTVNTWTSVVGSNVPRSKISNAAFSTWYRATGYAGSSVEYAGAHHNFYFFGAAQATGISSNSILKPEEAWNIDTKLDDGKPGYGKIIAVQWNSCTFAASETDYAADYDLSNTAIACALQFPNAF